MRKAGSIIAPITWGAALRTTGNALMTAAFMSVNIPSSSSGDNSMDWIVLSAASAMMALSKDPSWLVGPSPRASASADSASLPAAFKAKPASAPTGPPIGPSAIGSAVFRAFPRRGAPTEAAFFKISIKRPSSASDICPLAPVVRLRDTAPYWVTSPREAWGRDEPVSVG